MDIAKKIEAASDHTQGNFKVALVKVVLGSVAGFLATVATQKIIGKVANSDTSSIPVTIVPE